MGAQFRICRRVQSVPVVANGFATVDLPRGYDYEALFLRLNGSVNTGAHAGAITAVRAEAPCQMVPRIDVIADGKTMLFSAPFWFASLGSTDRPVRHANARVTTPPSGFTASQNYTFEAIGSIDFATIDGVRTKDSNFRTGGLSLFQARIQFGAYADLFVGGGATVVAGSTPTTLELWTSELVEIPDAAGRLPAIPFLKKISYQDISTPTANAALEQRLPAGNLLRGVMIRTDGTATAGEPSVALLNAAKLQSGVDVRMEMTGPQIRAKNNLDIGPLQTGYYSLDVLAIGPNAQRLSELFDVTRQAEPKIVMDVAGPFASARVQLVTIEYIQAQPGA